MSAFAIAAVFAAIIMIGAFVGGYAKTRLRPEHLDSKTEDTVKVGIGFISTLAALVLGLIVASAKSSFDFHSDEVRTAAAKVSQLDGELRQLGSPADPARELARRVMASRIEAIWHRNEALTVSPAAMKATPVLQDVRSAIRKLAAADEAQQTAKAKALQLTEELMQVRAIALAHTGSSVNAPLLILLVLWLGVITAGLNLFAPRNGTVTTFNVLCAVSAASAIFLILEMDQPYDGLIKISEEPLQAALAQMAR